jgi:hypothetical protein
MTSFLPQATDGCGRCASARSPVRPAQSTDDEGRLEEAWSVRKPVGEVPPETVEVSIAFRKIVFVHRRSVSGTASMGATGKCNASRSSTTGRTHQWTSKMQGASNRQRKRSMAALKATGAAQHE